MIAAEIYNKTAFGLPSSEVIGLIEHKQRLLTFTHSALWGNYKATIQIADTMDQGFMIADQWLGNPVKLWDVRSNQVWEGYVWAVKISAGRRRRIRSLEGYANTIYVHYQEMDFSTSPPTSLGSTAHYAVGDATGQALYGYVEEHVNEGGLTATSATNIANRRLSERTRLLYAPESGSAESEEPIIELFCYGFFRTLFYRAYTANTTGTADLSSVIQTMLLATAGFISSDYSRMATTGVNVQRQFDKYEYTGDLIKRLLKTASGYTFGIDFNQIPYLRANNRTASTAHYLENQDGTITDASSMLVDAWMIRPDAVLRQVDLVPATVNASVAIDSIESLYLAETTWSSKDPGRITYKAAVAGIDGAVEP